MKALKPPGCEHQWTKCLHVNYIPTVCTKLGEIKAHHPGPSGPAQKLTVSQPPGTEAWKSAWASTAAGSQDGSSLATPKGIHDYKGPSFLHPGAAMPRSLGATTGPQTNSISDLNQQPSMTGGSSPHPSPTDHPKDSAHPSCSAA